MFDISTEPTNDKSILKEIQKINPELAAYLVTNKTDSTAVYDIYTHLKPKDFKPVIPTYNSTEKVFTLSELIKIKYKQVDTSSKEYYFTFIAMPKKISVSICKETYCILCALFSTVGRIPSESNTIISLQIHFINNIVKMRSKSNLLSELKSLMKNTTEQTLNILEELYKLCV